MVIVLNRVYIPPVEIYVQWRTESLVKSDFETKIQCDQLSHNTARQYVYVVCLRDQTACGLTFIRSTYYSVSRRRTRTRHTCSVLLIKPTQSCTADMPIFRVQEYEFECLQEISYNYREQF